MPLNRNLIPSPSFVPGLYFPEVHVGWEERLHSIPSTPSRCSSPRTRVRAFGRLKWCRCSLSGLPRNDCLPWQKAPSDYDPKCIVIILSHSSGGNALSCGSTHLSAFTRQRAKSATKLYLWPISHPDHRWDSARRLSSSVFEESRSLANCAFASVKGMISSCARGLPLRGWIYQR